MSNTSQQQRAWGSGPQIANQQAGTTPFNQSRMPYRRSTAPDGFSINQFTPSTGPSSSSSNPYSPSLDQMRANEAQQPESTRSTTSAPRLDELVFSDPRMLPFASEQTSPSSSKAGGGSGSGSNSSFMPIVSRITSSERQSPDAVRSYKMAEPNEKSGEGQFVSLAVPYANTVPSTRPTLGDRPLQASGVVNGVAKHNRTSTPMHETQTPKAGKRNTLNLLNPVNLLMRRRSGLPPAASTDTTTRQSRVVPAMTLPENYDPRIRGSVVHDFSAPRPRRTSSQQHGASGGPQADQSSDASKDVGPLPPPQPIQRPLSSGDANRLSQHSAVFREHLEDDSDHDRVRRQSAINAESLANQDFLNRLSQQDQQQQYDPAMLPAFARNSQHMDFQQFRRSIGEWQARLSDPSLSDKSSSPSNIQSDHQQSESHVSSEHSTRDRSSSPFINTEDARMSPESPNAAQQRSSHTTVQSQEEPSDDDRVGGGLPKHFKSNASRFSFQLGGNDNALEESLLEERAKHQRQLDETKKSPALDEDEDFFDENAMYDLDELEERDAESGLNEEDTTLHQDAAGMPATEIAWGQQAQSQGGVPILSLQEGSFAMQPNSNIQQYLEYQRAQMQVNQDSQQGAAAQTPQWSYQSSDAPQADSDKRSDSHQGLPEGALLPPVDIQGSMRRSRQSHDFDDDFYFNDGTVEVANYEDEENDDAEEDVINEDELFGSDHEDEMIRTRRSVAASRNRSMREPDSAFGPGRETNAIANEGGLGHLRPGTLSPPASKASPARMSSNRLAAYHSALAEAAQKAAAEGRFSRATSSATSASKYSEQSHGSQRSAHDTKQDVSRQSSGNARQPSHLRGESYSGFDFGFNDPSTQSTNTPLSASFPVNAVTTVEEDNLFDDGLDDFDGDDAIISEANADALANDDEGFYGSEFGFYAKARSGSDPTECVNGGYFGAPGGSIIERKYSVKEPNLTPITERSEFSTRTSLVGGPFTPMTANPAFAAQLARMSPLALAHMQEDEITMEQMLRLRALPFAGSEHTGRSGSVSSLSSAAGFSGLSHRGSWTTAAAMGAQFVPRNSTTTSMAFQYSTDSERSSQRMSRSHSDVVFNEPAFQAQQQQESPLADSPISGQSSRLSNAWLAQDDFSTPRKPSDKNVLASPQAPTTAIKSAPKRGQGHARSQSGGGMGDSITYTKERDDEGKERWVLERKRTSEAGLVELVGREILEGGRI